MREHPILFSAPMVAAIIDGSKTETRRVIKPQPAAGDTPPCVCPRWIVGDRLWVREKWKIETDGMRQWLCYAVPGPMMLGRDVSDRITHADAVICGDPVNGIRWRSPIHMFRWASRITLEITDIRIQRVQDISEADAMAEGFEKREHFIRLWEELNGKRGFGFDSNCWVWALTFRRIDPIGGKA